MAHFISSGQTPANQVKVYRDGELVESVALSPDRESTITLECDDRPTVFRFEVKDTFVPSQRRVNNDHRELGVFVRLEPVVGKAAAAAENAIAGRASSTR